MPEKKPFTTANGAKSTAVSMGGATPTKRSAEERKDADGVVRMLLPSMFTTKEANELIEEYGYDAEGEDFSSADRETEVAYAAKIGYLTRVCGAYVAARCGTDRDGFTRARTDYYSILSALIMPNWG